MQYCDYPRSPQATHPVGDPPTCIPTLFVAMRYLINSISRRGYRTPSSITPLIALTITKDNSKFMGV